MHGGAAEQRAVNIYLRPSCTLSTHFFRHLQVYMRTTSVPYVLGQYDAMMAYNGQVGGAATQVAGAAGPDKDWRGRNVPFPMAGRRGPTM
jgi:hypothetical protein